ncbi:MAG TPA: mechanosensitive ion channel domain-containing protein [Gallionellaceae bacterium]|nr:mechanosensitive ion channel domain-containing protein [Gallionellaceae bacterium]
MNRLWATALCFFICAGLAGSALASRAHSAANTQNPPPHASAARSREAATVFPVSLGGINIIDITRSPIASLTPESRARSVQQNIQTFADSKEDIHSLKLTSEDGSYAIGNGRTTLIVITAEDAKSSGMKGDALASETLTNIQQAVAHYRTTHAWKTYSLALAFALLATLALWLALHLNNRAYRWLVKKTSILDSHIGSGIQLRGVTLFKRRDVKWAIVVVLKAIRVIIALLCLYFFVPLILSLFPETHELSTQIFSYFVAPFVSIFTKLAGFVPNLFYIFVIGVIARYALKVIAFFFTLLEREQLRFEWFYSDWARPTYQIVRFLVIVIAVISAYPYIPGSSSQAFQGIGLVLGAIISFASSSAISNIVAGIILTYTRAFRLNDRIKVGETMGDVVEKTLLVTRINTIKQVIVTIPNSLVMGAQIVNYSTSANGGDGVILHTSVTIGYDTPWKTVNELLIAAARDTGSILKDPAPFVLQTSLDDYYVSYEINAYTRDPASMATFYSDLHRNILDKFDEAGVEIMSPHYLSLRDGNATTVPRVLGEKDYVQPSFQVRNAPPDSGAGK